MRGNESSRVGRWMLLVIVSIGLVGCRNSQEPDVEFAEYDEARLPLIDLPGLLQADAPRLQDELSRIVDERGTPALIVETNVPARDNLAQSLVEVFRKSRLDLAGLARDCEQTMPRGVFKLDSSWTDEASRLASTLELQREKIRSRLDDPGVRFEVPYTENFAIPTALRQSLWIYARLEAFEAASALRRDDLDRAVQCVTYMLRLATLMAGDKDPVLRLEAAFVRTEALKVAQAVVQTRGFSRAHLELLYAELSRQLDAWPPDSFAWIGNRALGLWVYEMARDGRLQEVLTTDEMAEWEAASLPTDAAGLAEGIDEDQLYYLAAMRRIIEGCDQPFRIRKSIFESIQDDLAARWQTPAYPPIAGRLLLPDVESGHAIQARDRANVEGWVLACEKGLGVAAVRPIDINPLTGDTYRVETTPDPLGEWPGMIRVTGIGTGPEDDDDPPVVVPDLTN